MTGVTPSITIVVPLLNGRRYLAAALDSIAAQTLRDWECRIMDGGSTDGSLEIAHEYAERDARFTVESNSGQGLYPAVIAGLDAARGNICGWLGSDDMLAPWAFATVADFARGSGARWIAGMPGAWDAEGRLRVTRGGAWHPRGLIKGGWFHEELLGFIQQESVFFARSLYAELTAEERARIAALSYAGDYLLWRMFAKREKLSVLPALLAGFRIHGENLSARKLDAYMDEVRASGAPMPPARIGRRLGMAFELVSALVTLWRQRKDLTRLGSEAAGR